MKELSAEVSERLREKGVKGGVVRGEEEEETVDGEPPTVCQTTPPDRQTTPTDVGPDNKPLVLCKPRRKTGSV